jgi:hypothetical protein
VHNERHVIESERYAGGVVHCGTGQAQCAMLLLVSGVPDQLCFGGRQSFCAHYGTARLLQQKYNDPANEKQNACKLLSQRCRHYAMRTRQCAGATHSSPVFFMLRLILSLVSLGVA